jgi:transcriptional regulator with XRE-family HTH domain
MSMFAELGAAIKLLRVERKVTQQELEKLAKLGKGLISRYERGASTPNFTTVERILTALDVDLAELLQAIGRIQSLGVEVPDLRERERRPSRQLRYGGRKMLVSFEVDTTVTAGELAELREMVEGLESMLMVASTQAGSGRRKASPDDASGGGEARVSGPRGPR